MGLVKSDQFLEFFPSPARLEAAFSTCRLGQRGELLLMHQIPWASVLSGHASVGIVLLEAHLQIGC